MSAAFAQAFAKSPCQQIAYRVFNGETYARFRIEIQLWIWKRICYRSRCRRAATGAKCPAKASARTLHGAVQRNVLYLSAPHQPPHLDLPHSPFGHAQAVCRSTDEADSQRAIY